MSNLPSRSQILAPAQLLLFSLYTNHINTSLSALNCIRPLKIVAALKEGVFKLSRVESIDMLFIE